VLKKTFEYLSESFSAPLQFADILHNSLIYSVEAVIGFIVAYAIWVFISAFIDKRLIMAKLGAYSEEQIVSTVVGNVPKREWPMDIFGLIFLMASAISAVVVFGVWIPTTPAASDYSLEQIHLIRNLLRAEIAFYCSIPALSGIAAAWFRYRIGPR
jgi:hypothetical protein